MRRYSNPSQQGFSLLEILVAVAIISVVLVMAMLNYGQHPAELQGQLGHGPGALPDAFGAREGHLPSPRGPGAIYRDESTPNVRTLDSWHAACGEASQLRGGAQFIVFSSVPDLPAPYNFGNSAPIYFGGLSGAHRS